MFKSFQHARGPAIKKAARGRKLTQSKVAHVSRYMIWHTYTSCLECQRFTTVVVLRPINKNSSQVQRSASHVDLTRNQVP